MYPSLLSPDPNVRFVVFTILTILYTPRASETPQISLSSTRDYVKVSKWIDIYGYLLLVKLYMVG